tara:strand:+ start:1443 stop:2252 length:810 start_codon:yes stop_codon:yes gene_type:complete
MVLSLGSIGNFLGGNIGGTIGGALLGGGLAYLGSRETASAARDAARMESEMLNQNAVRAEAAGVPYSVGSLGGTAEFDPETKTSLLNLSPELSNIYSGLLSRSGLFGEQAGMLAGLDPFQAGEAFYQMQQQYRQPEEDRLRTNAETRLLAQGRLGSTGGAQAQEALERAIAQDQGQRRYQSMTQAQSLIDALLGRETADITQATSLLNIPYAQGQLGQGIASNITSAMGPALAARNQAARNLSLTSAQSPSGTAMSALGGLFMQPRVEK